MKTLNTLGIVMLALVSAGAAETKIAEFEVSKAGPDKTRLFAVFDAVAAMETKRPPGMSFEVSRRITSQQFIVWKIVSRVSPFQNIDRLARMGAYVNGSENRPPATYQETDYGTSYLLLSASPLNAADGEKIMDVPAVESAQVRAVDGQQLRVFDLPAAEEKVFTREDFVARLKAGATWTLRRFDVKNCHPCGGDGKLSAMEKLAKCPQCAGQGSTSSDLLVRW